LDDTSVASASDRIVVSHDCNTMTDHFYRFLEQATSPGLIIVPQELDLGTAVEGIVLIAEASDASEHRGFITWLGAISAG
jgi:hypothetical protein